MSWYYQNALVETLNISMKSFEDLCMDFENDINLMESKKNELFSDAEHSKTSLINIIQLSAHLVI